MNLYNVPVDSELQHISEQIARITNQEQLYWLHGYLSGLLQQKKHALNGVVQTNGSIHLEHQQISDVPSETLTILYGTQSGNSKKIAEQLFEKAKSLGLMAKNLDMGEYNPRDLKNENKLLIIVSTHGEGEPPLAAETLLEYLQSKKASRLEHIKYAVLALGDKGYVNFCKTGADFDKHLELLGATRIHERVDCDVDYKANAEKWINEVLEKSAKSILQPVVKASNGNGSTHTDLFTRENPGKLLVTEAINLNGRGSSKNTIHLELSDEGQNLQYKPGDSLGLFFENPKELVEDILSFLKIENDELVSWQQQNLSIYEVLLKKAEIIQINRELIENFGKLSKNPELTDLVNDLPTLSKYIYGRDLLDLLHEYPFQLSAAELAAILRPMQARLYSIASSPLYVPGEVHITVDVLKYEFHNRNKNGACSSYLSTGLEAGNYVTAFISPNESFRLPDGHKDIIMIGPGTGVAPFRSFVQHRVAQESAGKNWLFFGSQHFTTDFLYQTEWQKYQKDKALHRIDLAFSRDQKEKIYVQHRMLQKSKELYSWIENGAIIYVCGDKSLMAKDVHASFIEIISKEGGMSEEKAQEYLKDLRKQKRYLEDVY